MKKNGKKGKKPSDSISRELNIIKKSKKCDNLKHHKLLVPKGVIIMKSDDDYEDMEYNESDEEEDIHADDLNNQKPPLSKDGRLVKEMKISKSGLVPKAGYIFKPGQIRTAGDYYLGPILGSSPVRSMVQCLGRKKNTDEFYTLKILTIRESSEETQDDKQGKMLLHTEHSLLSFLNGQPGIIKEHGLFEDYACDGVSGNTEEKAMMIGNGKFIRRICLVLDCVIPHGFDTESSDYINLQHYVIGKRKLMELDALIIFYNIVSVVKNLHDLNVIHRDLKLANLVLNKRNRQIILTNFCLGQHLVSEDDKLLDQRGSPAYISPDVLIGKPYLGKPSDMWALGVVLFTMLYGQFPFYHKYHQELFKMIKTAQYTVPSDGGVKSDTLEVIQSLLCLDPLTRSTASQILTKLTSVITKRLTPETFTSHDAQVVPDLPEFDEEFEAEENDSKGKFSPDGEGEEIDMSREKDSSNVLDYLIRAVPHTDIPVDKKTSLSFTSSASGSRGNINFCYSMVNTEDSSSVGSSSRSASTISIIEGDLRTFTQSDLFTHRSIFPHYSGPDLFGGWRNPSSVPPPPPPPPPSSGSSSPTTGRNLPRIGTISGGPVRMPSSRLTLPSIHIPTSNNSPNLYEFPPARRWALAVLQQIHNNPNAKAPVVPQLEFNVPDVSKPSTSGVPNEVQRPTSSVGVVGGVADEPKIKGILSNKSPTKPSCSGIGKKVTFMEDPEKPLDRDRTAEEPGPSAVCPPEEVQNRERPAWSKSRRSNLALKRTRNKAKTRMSSKCNDSLRKLQILNNHFDTIIKNGGSTNNGSSSSSSGSGSSSSSSSGSSNSSSSSSSSSSNSSDIGGDSFSNNTEGDRFINSSNENAISNLDRELISSYNGQDNLHSEYDSECEMSPSTSTTNSQDEIGFLNAEDSLIPTDNNNNNDEINNNSDDNNNSENNNLNISSNNNLNDDGRDNQFDMDEN